MTDWMTKLGLALIPIGLVALVTIAWDNSHTLSVLSRDEADLRADIERLERTIEACRNK
jgi:hypothetical protein